MLAGEQGVSSKGYVKWYLHIYKKIPLCGKSLHKAERRFCVNVIDKQQSYQLLSQKRTALGKIFSINIGRS